MDIPSNMQRTILFAALAAAGIGVGGAFAGPHADVLALAPTWAAAMVRLAGQAGRDLDRQRALKLTTALLASIGSFAGGMKLATSYFAWSGVATLPAVVANAGANGVMTWLALRACAQVFLERDLTQSIDSLVRAILALLGGMLRPQG